MSNTTTRGDSQIMAMRLVIVIKPISRSTIEKLSCNVIMAPASITPAVAKQLLSVLRTEHEELRMVNLCTNINETLDNLTVIHPCKLKQPIKEIDCLSYIVI